MFSLSGCWNYREVDKLVIVAGIAIDKNFATNKYLLTFETLKPSGGKEGKIESEKIETDGDSIFDAIRNAIKISGKKLYWSHAETVIISKDVAKEGILPILDLLSREREPRLNLMLVVSKAETAKEILTKKAVAGEITSFSIDQIIKGSTDSTKSIHTELYNAIHDIEQEGKSISLPTVSVIKNIDKETLDVSGVALFKKDKLVGFLSDIETKPFLYAKDNVKGGLLYFKVITDAGNTGVTLEVSKSTSKTKATYEGGKIVINIDINTEAIIAELDSAEDLLDEKGIETIKYVAQKNIENDVENIIKKVQSEYDTDVFGFGKLVKESMPSHWREVKGDWDNYYKNLDVKVKSKVDITGSAEIKSPVKVGE